MFNVCGAGMAVFTVTDPHSQGRGPVPRWDRGAFQHCYPSPASQVSCIALPEIHIDTCFPNHGVVCQD